MHYECGAGPSTSSSLTSREQLVSVVRNEKWTASKDASASRLPRAGPSIALTQGLGLARTSVAALTKDIHGRIVSHDMATFHDPIGHLDRLRQALESSKRPLGFLLSTGCPLAVRQADGRPLIPDVAGMTSEMRVRMQASEHSEAFAKVEIVLAEDGAEDADLEYILSLTRSLCDVAGVGGARGLSRDELQILDEAMSEEIAQLASPLLTGTDTPYHDLMHWVGSIARDHPVELFTTNYDLLAEQALEDVGVPYFDGFVGAREAFFDVRAIEDDVLPSRWARLWKLHGSIN